MNWRFIQDRLNQPYPQPVDFTGIFRKAIVAGVFVSLIDLVFQPFGLASFEHPYKLLVTAGFVVPVFFWVAFYGVMMPKLFPVWLNLNRWRVRDQLLGNIVIMLSITVTLFFYSRAIGFKPFSSVSYLFFCALSFAIVITIFFLFFDKSVHLEKTDQRATREVEELRMLVRESHHRMRNHLQVIASMLRLQTNVVTDARALEVLRTSESRLESIAILHEKLYRRENTTPALTNSVALREYLEELTQIIARNHADLAPPVAIQVEDRTALTVPLDTAVPLGLIVNELLTNSFKYAFRELDEGRICVTLDNAHDGRHELTVCDNGPGLPVELLQPTGLGPTRSLGMRLVRALTQQLRGELAYQHNGGAEFVVRF